VVALGGARGCGEGLFELVDGVAPARFPHEQLGQREVPGVVAITFADGVQPGLTKGSAARLSGRDSGVQLDGGVRAQFSTRS